MTHKGVRSCSCRDCPKRAARGWCRAADDGDDGPGGGEDGQAPAGKFDGDGRAVAGRIVAEPPARLAGVLVEGGDGVALAAARMHDHLIAHDQRRTGQTPEKAFVRTVFRTGIEQNIRFPEGFAIGGVQAKQLAERKQTVEFAVVNGRRGAR